MALPAARRQRASSSMHDRIMVGYDGSVAAANAARWALAEARVRGATLTLVRCYRDPVDDGYGIGSADEFPAEVLQAMHDGAGRSVGAMADELRTACPGVHVCGRAVHGSPRHELAEMAEQADLLVLGTTGSGRASNWLLGSVAYALARTAPCPVALVPRFGPSTDHPNVVLGYDGSPPSWAALDWAIDECDRLNGDLTIVHAWQFPYSTLRDEVRDIVQVDAACELDEAIEHARDRGGSKAEGLLVEGRPAEELLSVGLSADLIVLGSRGRGGLAGLLLGSVSQAVISHAMCPVVVVR